MYGVSRCALSLLAAAIPLCLGLAPQGPWDEFNLAPASRISRPNGIYSFQGSVQDQHNLLESPKTSGVATLSGKGSYIVLDFGQEVWPGQQADSQKLKSLGRGSRLLDYRSF